MPEQDSKQTGGKWGWGTEAVGGKLGGDGREQTGGQRGGGKTPKEEVAGDKQQLQFWL